MTQYKNIISLLVLFALIAVAFSHENQGSAHNQGGQHQVQGRVRRQAEPQDENQVDVNQEEQEGQVQVDANQEHEGPGQGEQEEQEGQEGQDQVDDNQEQANQEQENEDEAEDVPSEWGPIGWTSCDFAQIPRISCHDCTIRKICKPIGGLLKQCGGSRPYCNSGLCSPVPSAECAAQA